MALTQKIQFRKLWNCCWGNEAAVITFDNGSKHAVCKRCANSYTGPVRDITEADLAEYHGWITEPREVGRVCYSGYSMEHYVVLNMSDDGEITVLWLGDGQFANSPLEARVTTHCTAWNPRKDRLASGSMFDCLDDPEEGSFVSYEAFLEQARDTAAYAVYVNEIIPPSYKN